MKTTIAKHFIACSVCCAIGVACAALASCTDYLDKAPESEIADTEAYKDFRNFQGFVEELYSCIPDFAKNGYVPTWNYGDDEIQNINQTFMVAYMFDQGDFWGWQKEHDGWSQSWLDRGNWSSSGDRFHHGLWPAAWYAIRKCAMGLANLDLMTGATQEEKDLIAGQLYFFRGWFYFEMMQYVGGLPYIKEVLPADQKLSLPRLSYAECADSAASDLRKAADLLPVNWDDTAAGRATYGRNQLRITKIMALAYLGKDLLWAGSPLMNKESTGNATYNKEFCQRSADAFAELIKLVDGGQTQYGLIPWKEYYRNFYTQNENGKMPGQSSDDAVTEAIFRGPSEGYGATRWSVCRTFFGMSLTDGDVINLPTANYVNYFGMANGLPLDDPESGFDATHPWKNRDPRFYNDVVYDGVRMVAESGAGNLAVANMQTDGTSRNTKTGSRTGYYNCKLVPITANTYDEGDGWSSQLHMHIPYMRMADVYLMYAEAAANATGSANGKGSGVSLTAVQAVNKVRQRAGVAGVAAKYTASLDGFMSELRRERAVELAWEGHRFCDLRRWLLLTKAPYTQKTSQEFLRVGSLNTSAPQSNAVSGWSEKVILTRSFTDKHYWLPLKQADTYQYLEFQQNPGW